MHPRVRYLPALDGLRGLAACWVFAYHLGDSMLGVNRSVGYLGVDLFFVLSGFVLSHVYAGERWSPSTFGSFLHVRIARIYPLHLVALFACLGLVVLWPGFYPSFPRPDIRFGVENFCAHLLLVQNWAHFMPTSWNVPAWSLSAEWAGYFLFPIVLWTAARFRWPLAWAFGCMVASEALLWAWGAGPNSQGSPGMGRMAFGMLAGCLVYRAYLRQTTLRPLPVTVGALLLLILAHVPGFAMAGVFGFPALVLLAARSEGLVGQICGSRPAVWLGKISYSVYLWHWLVIQTATRLPGIKPTGVVWCTSVVASVLLLSWASNSWIERPARSWVLRHRFSGGAPRADAQAPAPSQECPATSAARRSFAPAPW